jgi:hypothetical protein
VDALEGNGARTFEPPLDKQGKISVASNRALLTLLLVVLATACGTPTGTSTSTSTSTENGTSAGPVSQTETAPTMPRPTPPCTETYRAHLDVTTDKEVELQYLPEVTACTNISRTALLIVNDSEAAWTVTTADPDATVDQLTHTIQAEVFRATAAQVYRYAVIAPQSSVVVHAAPARIEWNLAPGLSVAGLAQEQVIDKLSSVATELVTEIAANGSSRRHAVIACGVAAFHFARDAGDGLTGSDLGERLWKRLGIGAEITECGHWWLRADDEARVKFGEIPRWTTEIEALGHDAQFLAKADEEMSLLSRVGKALILLER